MWQCFSHSVYVRATVRASYRLSTDMSIRIPRRPSLLGSRFVHRISYVYANRWRAMCLPHNVNPHADRSRIARSCAAGPTPPRRPGRRAPGSRARPRGPRAPVTRPSLCTTWPACARALVRVLRRCRASSSLAAARARAARAALATSRCSCCPRRLLRRLSRQRRRCRPRRCRHRRRRLRQGLLHRSRRQRRHQRRRQHRRP